MTASIILTICIAAPLLSLLALALLIFWPVRPK